MVLRDFYADAQNQTLEFERVNPLFAGPTRQVMNTTPTEPNLSIWPEGQYKHG